MISAIIVMMSLAVVGLPIAMLFDRGARGGGLIGLGFLLSSATATILMLLMSIVGWKWSLWSIVAGLIVVSAGCFVALRGRATVVRNDPFPTVLSLVVDSVTILAISGHAIYATLTAPWAWDFWAIWGMKARVFFMGGGVDWEWLARPFNDFVHPDYPPLLVFLFDFMALSSHSWSDRWLGVLYVALVLAGVGIVRDLLLRGTSDRNLTSIAGLLAAGTLASPWIGLAEIPLMIFTGAALLYLRHAEKSGDSSAMWCGSVLLGCGALTKNEGLAFVVSALIATAIVFRFDRRWLVRLWPAVALAAMWQIVRLSYRLQNDLFVGDVGDRAATKLQNVSGVFSALVEHPPDRHVFWILTLTIVFLGMRHVFHHERLLALAVAIQLSFYVGSYLVTPHEVVWHVLTSWSRLADQVALPLSILALLILFRRSDQPTEAQHAAAQ